VQTHCRRADYQFLGIGRDHRRVWDEERIIQAQVTVTFKVTVTLFHQEFRSLPHNSAGVHDPIL